MPWEEEATDESGLKGRENSAGSRLCPLSRGPSGRLPGWGFVPRLAGIARIFLQESLVGARETLERSLAIKARLFGTEDHRTWRRRCARLPECLSRRGI
jgi:hypothetical protein